MFSARGLGSCDRAPVSAAIRLGRRLTRRCSASAALHRRSSLGRQSAPAETRSRGAGLLQDGVRGRDAPSRRLRRCTAPAIDPRQREPASHQLQSSNGLLPFDAPIGSRQSIAPSQAAERSAGSCGASQSSVAMAGGRAASTAKRLHVRPSQRSCFLEICHPELSCRTDARIPTHHGRSHVRRKEYDAYIVGGTPRGGFAHPSQRRGTDQRPQSFVQLYDSERANVPGTRGPDSLLARPPAFQQDVHAPALRSAISGTQPGATGRWSLQQVRGAAIGRGRIRILDGGSSRARRRRPFARTSLPRRSPECCVLVFSPPEPPSQPAHSELSISPPLEC